MTRRAEPHGAGCKKCESLPPHDADTEGDDHGMIMFATPHNSSSPLQADIAMSRQQRGKQSLIFIQPMKGPLRGYTEPAQAQASFQMQAWYSKSSPDIIV